MPAADENQPGGGWPDERIASALSVSVATVERAGGGENFARIIETYQNRTDAPRYSRGVGMEENEKNDWNVNISRYITTMKR